MIQKRARGLGSYAVGDVSRLAFSFFPTVLSYTLSHERFGFRIGAETQPVIVQRLRFTVLFVSFSKSCVVSYGFPSWKSACLLALQLVAFMCASFS